MAREAFAAALPSLRATLFGLFPSAHAADDSTWGDPREQLVEELIEDAHWIRGELEHLRRGISKQDTTAEHLDLLSNLQETERKLRSLSPGHAQLLPVDFDPLRLADEIARHLAVVEATPLREVTNSNVGQPQNESYLIKELASRVVARLQAHGIPAGATAPDGYGKPSQAVLALQAIGNVAGILRKPVTWKGAIAAAKSSDEQSIGTSGNEA
jgi:hypothetical protein